MRTMLFAAAAAIALIPGAAIAQSAHEVRHDQREIRHDRREVQRDLRQGRYHEAREDRRELLIGRDTRGYVALYRYLSVIDTALVLAIRAQREGGYARDE